MTATLPAQADPAHLTALLRRAGVLGEGRVAAVEVVHHFPTLLSQFHRLRLGYENAPEGAPRHLYLKTDRPGRPGADWNSGPREVAFYRDVAPLTPAGLLPRCYEAAAGPDGTWHLLLEDLTDSHAVATQWPLPPPREAATVIATCLARFHAAWWNHPRLGDGIGVRPTEAEALRWLDGIVRQYAAFADALGDRLPAHRRALYERLLAEGPRLMRRRRSTTILQGDAHVWNCFVPKPGTAETARLFDWDGWRIGSGTEDFAYMIAMHWYPEMRREREGPLLDACHDTLQRHGVTGYDRGDLQEDYRHAVLWATTRPIWSRAAGIPPSVWWSHLERIHLAADDLGCRDLLG